MHFINTNLPEERVQVLRSKTSELPADSPNILKKINLIFMWKEQIQHSAMQNAIQCFKQFFVTQNF